MTFCAYSMVVIVYYIYLPRSHESSREPHSRPALAKTSFPSRDAYSESASNYGPSIFGGTAVSNSPSAQQKAIIGKKRFLYSIQAHHCGCQIASLVDSNSDLRLLLLLADVARVIGENGHSTYLSILQCQPNGINYQDGT